MELGIPADIHEHTRELQKAIAVLPEHGAERFVVLGDVFETGKRIEQTVRLLRQVEAVGVWGNHDVGLCFDPGEEACRRYSAAVLDFMGRLQPHLATDGCLFTHVEPWLDPHTVEGLRYFHGPPDSPEKLARSFAAVPHRVLFIGHLHRWLLGTPGGLLPWRGENPVAPDSQSRYLVVVHAVRDGKCALFDTKTGELTPFGEARKGGVPMTTFADMGIPFPLFAAPTQEASEYVGLAACVLCGRPRQHYLVLRIGCAALLPCPACATLNGLDTPGRQATPCRACHREVPFPDGPKVPCRNYAEFGKGRHGRLPVRRAWCRYAGSSPERPRSGRS